MGGRLDATNVIKPLVSVITNVSMDHEQYLGNTLAEVAGEKAGIIKPGIPVVSGVKNDTSLEVVADRCKEMNSPLHLLGRDFSGERCEDGTWNYRGIEPTATDRASPGHERKLPDCQCKSGSRHHRTFTAAWFSDYRQQLHAGLSHTRWPGRLEEFWLEDKQVCSEQPATADARHFLLDGAHNPDGVRALRLALENEFSYNHLILIWGAMSDKDLAATLQTIAPLADHILFTRPESERSAMPETLLHCLPAPLQNRAASVSSVEKALEMAIERATEEDLICVAGSLYLVGKARQILLGELVKPWTTISFPLAVRMKIVSGRSATRPGLCARPAGGSRKPVQGPVITVTKRSVLKI